MAEINKEDLISKEALDVLVQLNNELLKIDGTFREIAKTAKITSQQIVQGSGLKKQREEADKLAKAEERLKFAQSELGKEIAKVNTKTQEQNRINRANAKEVNNISNAYDKLSRKRTEAQRNLKHLIVTEGELSKNTIKARKEFERLNKTFERVNKITKDGRQFVGQYERAWNGLKSIFAAGGLVLGVQTLFRVLKDGLKTIKDYTTANATLRGILNATKDETVALRDQQKQLGASTAFTATQVTKAQTELARLGLSLTEIVDLTPSILDASVAMGVDMADAALLVAGQLNAYNLAATEGGRVSDVLTKATQISAFNFEKLNTSLGIVSPAAKAVNISLEETVAILSAAVDSNIDASTAATGLRNIFIDLEAKGITWSDAMAKINGSTDRLSTANDLFGKRGAVVATVIANSTDKINENTIALNNAAGAAEAFAKEQLDNLEGDLKLATSAWEGLVLSIEDGEGIISKILRGTVQFFTNFIGGLQLINENGKSFIKAWTGIFGVFYKGLTVVGDNFKNFGSIVIDTFKAVFQATKLNFTAAGELLNSAKSKIGEFKNPLKAMQKAFIESSAIAFSSTEKVSKGTEQILESLTEVSNKTPAKLSKIRQKLVDGLRQMNVELALASRKAAEDSITALEEKYFGGIDEAIEDSLSDWEEYNDERDRIDLLNSEASIERKKKEEDEKLRIEKEADAKRRAIQQASFDFASELGNGLFQIKQDQLNAELEISETQRQKELENAEGDKIKQTQINRKFDREQAKIKTKQAQANKQQALFDIAVQTAINVTKYVGGLPFTAPLLALAIATGLAKAAVVAARPIPKFAKGTENAPGTGGIFGEAGAELMVTNDGQSIIADKATYFQGKRFEGASIMPMHELSETLGTIDDARLSNNILSSAKLQSRKKSHDDDMLLIKISEVDKTLKSILNKPLQTQSISRDGIENVVSSYLNRVKWYSDRGHDWIK